MFGKARPEPQQECEPQTAFERQMAINNVSVDGLSAEKNVLKSIRRTTGASLKEIREYLFSGRYYFKYSYRDGDTQRYYDQQTRAIMIDICISRFGRK